MGSLKRPPKYGLAPCVGAVRLPKPVADLAWSAPGWDFPPSARRSRPGPGDTHTPTKPTYSAASQLAHGPSVDRENTAPSSQAKTAGELKPRLSKSVECCKQF